MCIKCVAKSNSFGEVVPGHELQFANFNAENWKAGEWGLIRNQILVAKWEEFACEEPEIIVTRLFEGISILPRNQQETIFWEVFHRFCDQFLMSPKSGFDLIQASKTVGYNSDIAGNHGIFSYWFFLRVAAMIKEKDAIKY